MATETEGILLAIAELTERRGLQIQSTSGIKYSNFSLDETDRMLKFCHKLKKLYAEMMPIDVDVNIHSLFDQENGILVLLKNTMSCRELEKVKIECLQFLREFSKNFKDKLLLKHVETTRNLVLDYTTSDETTAKEKEEALQVFIVILEMKRIMSDLEANETLQTLCNFESVYSKPPKRVFMHLYHAMGVLCKLYTNIDPAMINRVVTMLLQFLECKMSVQADKDYEAKMVEGCIDGMREIMYEYSMSEEDNANNNAKLYRVLKHFLDKQFIKERGKGVPRAGLRLLAEQGEQLAPRVYSDYKFWHTTFLCWASQSHPDLHRIGIEGLSTFYRLIAHSLQDKTEPSDKEVFRYFMSYFRDTVIESKNIHAPHEVGLAIQGFGQFSGPCAVHLDHKEVQEMFSVILSRAEDYLKQPASSDDLTLAYLPKYVLALGTIVSKIHSVGPQYHSTLQCLCVFLFEKYPILPIFAHQSCVEALLKTFESLSMKGTMIDEFLEQVVYQAVIRTCSHTVRMDAELLQEQMSAYSAYFFVTYDRYLPLWQGILHVSSVSRTMGISQSSLKVIASKVLNAFLQALLQILDKLDLSTHEKTQQKLVTNAEDSQEALEGETITLLEVIGMDPQTSLEASTPKDFQVFLNVVDLCQDLLPNVNKEVFSKWLVPLVERLMQHSAKFPLVSGFYKLLTLSLKMANQMDIFTELDISEDNQFFDFLLKFLRDVLLELGQYKGDLQVSCLYLVLATPLRLVPGLMSHILPAFQAIFSVGQNYIPLALCGITTLKQWHSNLQNPDILQPLLVSIVPYFDKFLRTQEVSNSSDTPEELLQLQSRKQTKFRAKRQVTQSQAGEKDTALSHLQREILLFLAELDSATCQCLVDVDSSKVAEEAVAWTSSKLLRFYLPFADMKPSIYLEVFLPRVTQLALTSSDRHTRVTACELLHASVLYLLGTGVQVAEDGKERKELISVFSCVMPALLSLGCDSDLLVQQLFQPLVLQLTHYFSSRAKLGSQETAVLMQTLMDGLTDEKDMGIRDFASVSLKEFIVWSIKQSSHRDLENTPLNITSILNTIFYFCLHSSPFKRLGGALAVNCLYTVLREEATLVDQFFLELLFYLVKSLQLSGPGETVLGIKQQTRHAINHVERVLRERANTFNQPSAKRRKPPDFAGVLLEDAVSWLLSLCSSPNPDCRHISMELVASLAQWIQGATTSVEALKAYQLKNGPDFLMKLCEAGLEVKPDFGSSSSVQTWLYQLLGSLECYTWLLEQELSTTRQIFDVTSQPAVFLALTNFVKYEFNDNFKTIHGDLSPTELEVFQLTKCSVMLSMVDLLFLVLKDDDTLFLSKPSFLQVLSPVRCAETWTLVCNMILKPQSVGFSLKTHQLLKSLEDKLSRFLSILPEKLPGMSLELVSMLTHYMSKCQAEFGNLNNLQAVVKSGASRERTSYVNGICLLHETGLAKNLPKGSVQLQETSGESMLEKVFASLAEQRENDVLYCLTISSTSRDFLNTLLSLAFLIGVQKKHLLQFVNDSTVLEDEKSRGFVTHGEIFFLNLKSPILEFLVKSPTESVTTLLKSSSMGLPHLKLCHTLLSLVYQRPHLNMRYGSEVSHAIMSNWTILITCETNYLLELVDIVAYVSSMSAKDSRYTELISTWICSKLSSRDLPLSLKRRCLDIIPPILSWGIPECTGTVRAALQSLCAINFPVRSVEYPAGSTQLTEYKSFFSRLLSLFLITQDLMLLDFIAMVVSRDGNHCCAEAVENTINIFINKLDEAQQLKSIQQIFKEFLKTENVPEVRLHCVTQFVVPMLQVASEHTVETFFLQHIPLLREHVSTTPVLDQNLSQFRARKQLVPLICTYSLVEVLYSRLPAASLSGTSAIGQAFSTDSKSVMSRVFLMKAIDTRGDASSFHETWKPLYLQYQACALKASVSITCCLFPDAIKDQSKYAMYIFNTSKHSFWAKIVDCNKDFSLKMDFEEVPARKKKLVCIRKSARQVKQDSPMEIDGTVSSVRYPASHQLFGSTLSEDVSRFDLSHVDLRSSTQSTSTQRVPREQEEVMLELDDINNNECMATLCVLVKKCGGDQTSSAQQLPEWMTCLRKSLISASQPKNVKLFIVKLIMNVEEVFKPYASHWLDPICLTIVEGSLGTTMNYILSDAVSMVLSWHDVAIPNTLSEKQLASDLLELLIKQAHHIRRDIVKHNLELIKTLVEVWKPILIVKYQLLFNIVQLGSSDVTLPVGLQVIAILLANKILPWNQPGSQSFIENLLEKHLMDTSRTSHRIAAEIIGIMIKWGNEAQPENQLLIDFETFLSKVKANLKTMLKKKNMFFPCIQIIHSYYSPIVDNSLHNLLHDFPHQIGDFKSMSLEMIASRIETMDNNVLEVSVLGLDRMMTSQTASDQEHALKIVSKLIPEMTSRQALLYVRCVGQVIIEGGPDTRKVAYELLMQVLRRKRQVSVEEQELLDLGVSGLLSGLSDQDQNLQQMVLNFWTSPDIDLPQSAADRFVALAKKVFVKDSAHLFMSNSLQLMLEATIDSPDYSKLIFERALSQCKFQSYKLVDSWRTRNATMMTPLFADTLSSQVASQSLAVSSMAPGLLRATQHTLAFQPTAVMQNVAEEFDDDADLDDTGNISFMSSFNQSWGAGPSNQRTQTQKTGGKPTWKRKYRFMSDKKRIRGAFARREIQLRAKRQQVVREHSAKKEGQVNLYRSYRFGDFPDIQIPTSSIIKPLQMLVKLDPIVARQLFVSLFSGILREFTELDTSNLSPFVVNINRELLRMFEESACCVPMLMAAIMEIALHQDNLQLPPDAITDVCTANSLAPLGCLLLEKYLNPTHVEPTPRKQARLPNENFKQNKWLKLAELYQALGERDVVLAVLQEALRPQDEQLKRAVQHEAMLQWQKAEGIYESCTTIPYVKNFTTEAYCRCLEHLSKWEDLNTWVYSQVPDDDNFEQLWTDPWNQEKLLPWLLKSEIHEIFEKGDIRDFTSLLSTWIKDKQKLNYLKGFYSEELSALSLVSGEAERAQLFSRHVLQNFLQHWSVLSTLVPQLRAQKLAELQSITEIVNFADVLQVDNAEKFLEKMQSLGRKWNISQPKLTDSLLIWELRTIYRSYFLKTLCPNKLTSLGSNMDPDLQASLHKTIFSHNMAFIDLALADKNLTVAYKFIRKTVVKSGESDLSLRHKVAVSRAKWLYANIVTTRQESFSLTMTALEDLRVAVEGSESGILRGQEAHARSELAELAWAASKLLCQHESLISLAYVQSPWITRYVPQHSQSLSPKEVAKSLEDYGQAMATQAVEMSRLETGTHFSTADALMLIVRHCTHTLHDQFEHIVNKRDQTELIVRCLLGAMKEGTKEARMFFPILLQLELLTKDVALGNLFKEEVHDVPEWMFLAWTNQLLAYINTDMMPLISDLLVRVATKYPKAFHLPFQFTLERLTSPMSTKLTRLVNKLKAILQPDAITERMLRALACVAQPEIILQGHLTAIHKNLQNCNNLNQLYLKLCEEVFPTNIGDSSSLHGDAFSAVAKYKPDLDKILAPFMSGKSTSAQALKKAEGDIVKVLHSLREDMEKVKKTGFKRRLQLEVYSNFLKQYRGDMHSGFEIPGQYTGDRIPTPQHHITINAFEPTVQVMVSLRSPVKLNLVGNNGRSYSFLVKAGEDLRQDERIQQLFSLMNNVLSDDQPCRNLKLHIKTYQVVPLNSRLGIIKFVPNCMSLQQFLESGASVAEIKKITKLGTYVLTKLEENAKGNKNCTVQYEQLYKKYDRQKTIQFFNDCKDQIPQDLLCRAFSKLSSCPEGLFWLRQSFTTSLAALSVAHWLVGIGDRHRSNMLVSQQTGAAVGIDFGHAFGSATQLLPVVELVPFRLTSSMLEIMGPLRSAGLFRSTMIKSLRAFRNNHTVLFCTMQVFVQEPSLDWQENAAKLAVNFGRSDIWSREASDSDPDQEMTVDYARQKIELMRHKIEGALPAVVMEEELSTGRKRSLPHLQVLRGDLDENLRAQLRAEAERQLREQGQQVDLAALLNCTFTVEQQVDCLIDQATDPQILGKTWLGWYPWM